jgi:uncharacterized protein (TIGR03437 family)
MLSLPRIVLIAWLSMTAVWAQPVITGIVNSASYAKAPLDPSTGLPVGNNIIAQGSIFTVFGTKLGSNSLISGPASLPLPLSLPEQNGTTISVTSGGRTVSAFPVSNAFGNQVAAILPSSTPLGAGTVTVTYNGQSSAAAKVTVVKAAPGIYTFNSQGNGPAIAQVADTGSRLNVLTNSVQAGQTLVLYGTGLGPITGSDNTRPGATPLPNVTVNLAGIAIQPPYAGRAPEFPGEDQINFVVPANAPTGCYVPLEVTSSGQPSNLVYVSIASGSSTCTHPLGLPAAALAKLDSGGTVNIGVFEILRAIASGIPLEGGGGLFANVNADGVFQLFNRIPNAFGVVNFPVASGACAVLDTLDVGSGALLPDFSMIGGKELSAGAGVGVSGPTGSAQNLMASSAGGYLNFLTNLGAGTWTLAGTRGPDIAAFNGKIDLPDNLVWTNFGNLTSPARGDLTITWTGGNANAKSLVTIFGSSIVINPSDPSKSRGKQFYCNAPASAGQFVVPASVLSQLPASSVDASAGEVAYGILGINSGGSAAFSAPLVAGGSIDAGFLSYGEAHTLNVKYR